MTKEEAKKWADRITAAEKRGRFLKGEHKMALTWTQCAVGEYRGQYKEIPAKHYPDPGEPRASTLSLLGGRFGRAVADNLVDEARELHTKITAYFARRKS